MQAEALTIHYGSFFVAVSAIFRVSHFVHPCFELQTALALSMLDSTWTCLLIRACGQTCAHILACHFMRAAVPLACASLEENQTFMCTHY